MHPSCCLALLPIDFTHANTRTWHIIPLGALCDRLDSLSVWHVAPAPHPRGAAHSGLRRLASGDDHSKVTRAGLQFGHGRAGSRTAVRLSVTRRRPVQHQRLGWFPFCGPPGLAARSSARAGRVLPEAFTRSDHLARPIAIQRQLWGASRSRLKTARRHQVRAVASAHRGAARSQLRPSVR
jgi:hypothetical protein